MKKGILFDLDGTLWDSSEEVATEMIQGVMGKSMTEIADIFF